MHVGFLGLGAIGAPMAVHLARRGPLTVWNRTASRAVEFGARHGATVAPTAREAATADVVITCLGTSADVASLLDGGDGLWPGSGPARSSWIAPPAIRRRHGGSPHGWRRRESRSPTRR